MANMIKRRRTPRRELSLDCASLESRVVPAPLAWASGANLPLPKGGISAQPLGANLLTMAGPTTGSYILSATIPSYNATTTSTVQPLDFARSSPGTGPLPDGHYTVFGGFRP